MPRSVVGEKTTGGLTKTVVFFANCGNLREGIMQEPLLLDMNNIFSIFSICYFSPFISPISIYEFINLIINLNRAKVSLFSIFID